MEQAGGGVHPQGRGVRIGLAGRSNHRQTQGIDKVLCNKSM